MPSCAGLSRMVVVRSKICNNDRAVRTPRSCPERCLPSFKPQESCTREAPWFEMGEVERRHQFPQELVDIILEDLRDDVPSLKQCSLVSRTWSTSTASHLFRRFAWPPCMMGYHWLPIPLQKPCDRVLGPGDSVVLLLELLSSSTRLPLSIRELRLASHEKRCSCAHTMGMSLYNAFHRVLPLLPHLRSFTLDVWRATVPQPFVDLRVDCQPLVLDKVQLNCKFEALQYLLSAFTRISKLSVNCPGGPGQGHAQMPRIEAGHLIVRSVSVQDWDESVLSALREIIDLDLVCELTLSGPPSIRRPAVGSIITSMPSLEALGYRRSDRSAPPFGSSHSLRLRSVMVGGRLFVLPVQSRPMSEDETLPRDEYEGNNEESSPHANSSDVGDGSIAEVLISLANIDDEGIAGGGLGDSEWDYILRDLFILVSAVTEDITIALTVDETYTSDDPSDPDDAENIARALWKAFSLVDWTRLCAVTRKCTNFRSLCFSVSYLGFIEPEECSEVLRMVLAKKLPSELVQKMRVETAQVSNLCQFPRF